MVDKEIPHIDPSINPSLVLVFHKNKNPIGREFPLLIGPNILQMLPSSYLSPTAQFLYTSSSESRSGLPIIH